jgi:outer membrane protein, heavy metal efflux system
MVIHRLLYAGIVSVFFTTSCVTYQEKKLEPKLIFNKLDYKRNNTEQFYTEDFSFKKATELMFINSPELKEIKSSYEIVNSVAKIKTPWRNPSVEIGPDIGSKLGVGSINKTQPFVSLGFSIPLAGKLQKKDDLNTAIAKHAFQEVQTKHRVLYLNLRDKYTQLYISLKKQDLQKELLYSSNLLVVSTESLMKTSVTSALDLGIAKINHEKIKINIYDVNNELSEIYSKLSILLGVDATIFKKINAKNLPLILKEPPDFDHLKEILIQNNTDLALIRSEYNISEKRLCLEISKQYPDISLGIEREEETGGVSTLLGLRLGVDVPIFNRNKQEIIKAKKVRENIKRKYVTKAHIVLSQLKQYYKTIMNNKLKLNSYQNNIKNISEKNLSAAKKSLDNGAIGIFKYFDIYRTNQMIKKDIIELEAELRKSWSKIEMLLGYPILEFPEVSKSEFINEQSPIQNSKEVENE